jgi:DNA-binding SARP family transcriptional activator
MLRLDLFGAMKVHVGAATVQLNGKPASLLAYLAMAHGQFFSRNELTLTLWCDQSAGTSSGCFNTALWRLRRVLPTSEAKLVISDRGGAIGLNPELPLQLDVREFERCITPTLAKPLAQCDHKDIAPLRQGLNLYRGDLLAGFTDEWAVREREKNHRLQLNALSRLMQLSARAQDWSDSISCAQTILDQDPLREDIHRELMALYLHSGQRALALRQFESCRTALKRELAIAPMPETQQLYQHIANAAVSHHPLHHAHAHLRALTALTQAVDEAANTPWCHSNFEPPHTSTDQPLQLSLPF